MPTVIHLHLRYEPGEADSATQVRHHRYSTLISRGSYNFLIQTLSEIVLVAHGPISDPTSSETDAPELFWNSLGMSGRTPSGQGCLLSTLFLISAGEKSVLR